MLVLEDGELLHVDSSKDILEHYGVKGMRWGKRTGSKKSSDSKKKTKFKKYAKIAGGVALAAGGAYLSYRLGKKVNSGLNNIKYDKMSAIANRKTAADFMEIANSKSAFIGPVDKAGARNRASINLDAARSIEAKYNKRGKRALYNNIEKIPTFNSPTPRERINFRHHPGLKANGRPFI